LGGWFAGWEVEKMVAASRAVFVLHKFVLARITLKAFNMKAQGGANARRTREFLAWADR
jgi:hypothetical protein